MGFLLGLIVGLFIGFVLTALVLSSGKINKEYESFNDGFIAGVNSIKNKNTEGTTHNED